MKGQNMSFLKKCLLLLSVGSISVILSGCYGAPMRYENYPMCNPIETSEHNEEEKSENNLKLEKHSFLKKKRL